AGVVEQGLQVGAHRRLQAPPSIGRLTQCRVHGLTDAVDAQFVDGDEQPLLGGEVHVDGAHGDADVTGDVANRGGGVAVRGAAFGGGRQDALTRLVLFALPDR